MLSGKPTRDCFNSNSKIRSMSNKKTIGIIGLGLIGGSIALACKGQGWKVYGSDESKDHISEAMDLGLVDKAISIDELVQKSDVISICTPVHKYEKKNL